MKTKDQLEALIAFTRLHAEAGLLGTQLTEADQAFAAEGWVLQARG